MSEHTKGAWRVGAETIDDEFIIETESDATVIGVARSWDGTEFRSEAEANARLIASAPALADENASLREVNKALLEACKAAKAAIDRWSVDVTDCDEMPHAMAVLVKAIALAEPRREGK